MNKDDLPKLPVFPLSNFIIFPKTTVPLNICEERYIQMTMIVKSNKLIGMIQPKILNERDNFIQKLYQVDVWEKLLVLKRQRMVDF